MRFLLDENVSYRVAGHLKAAGHEAVHISEIGLTSTDDAVILSRTQEDGWVLVTGDHDSVQMLSRAVVRAPFSGVGSTSEAIGASVDGDDFDDVVGAFEVVGVGCVKGEVVAGRCCGDHQV
jgi:Domain of unknown function (DUF5615)